MGSHLTIQQLTHCFHLRLLGWVALQPLFMNEKGSVPDFMTFPILHHRGTETQIIRMAAIKFHRSKSLLNAEGERGEESREKHGSFSRPEISALYKLGVFASLR